MGACYALGHLPQPRVGCGQRCQLIRGGRNIGHNPRQTGLVWFDKRQNRGIHHQDWRLEDNPAAVALFRRQARAFGRPLPPARLGG
jgi:hypothetical protein